MSMSLGRSFEERPKLEAQFFRNFSCCGLDLQDLHGLLEHFEECHVAFEEGDAELEGMEGIEEGEEGSEGTISGPTSPRLLGVGNGQELDMEMDDDLPPAQSTSAGFPSLNTFAPTPQMSAFDSINPSMNQPAINSLNPSLTSTLSPGIPLTPNPALNNAGAQANQTTPGAGGKKYASAMNPLAGPGAGLRYPPTSPSYDGASAEENPIPQVPLPEVTGNGIFVSPASNIHHPHHSLNSQHLQHNPSLGLAPSLLFPNPNAGAPGSGSTSPESYGEDVEGDVDLDGLGGSMEMGGPGGEEDGSPSSSVGAAGTPVDPTQLPGISGAGQHATSGIGVNSAGLQTLPGTTISALHPLGTGVQISPSGRPYTPPSEKPFKCSNAGNGKDDARGEGKPYVCHVVSCGKRYKNMNGLRYHYQHSGAHGALGLQMLAQAVHPPPQFPPGHKRAQGGGGSNNTSRASSPAPSFGSGGAQSRGSSPMGFGRIAGGMA
ncbi:SFP1, transcription regulator [Pseudohyphozyma bogoriensis]|nr:SFP1, transcription regulator [Pseudohyphozyma bogoriensis]